MCYSDLPPLYALRGFDSGAVPYIDLPTAGQYLEYPVLTGIFAHVNALMTGILGGGALTFYAVHVLLLGALFVVAIVATALVAGPRPWDGVLLAAAPALLVTATINWDLLAVALVAVWPLLWSRRAVLLAGVFLGLAIAAKFYPVVFIGPLLLMALRAGQVRALLKMLVAAALSWTAVNLPFVVANPQGWSTFYGFSADRGADLGSAWYALSIAGWTVPSTSVNTLGIVTLAVLCALIAVVIFFSPQLPRVAPMLFLTLAAFTLTNKVYSPQFVMWLVPLAVLALPRLRALLLWQAAELLYFAAVWWYLVDQQTDLTGIPAGVYAAAIAVRITATLWLCSILIRNALNPHLDPVRTSTGTDPCGGVFNSTASPRAGGSPTQRPPAQQPAQR